MKYLLSIVLSLFVLMGFYVYFIPYSKFSNHLVVDVPKGKTFYHLAEELEDRKIIFHSLFFKILVKLHGSPHLKMGEYELDSNQSLWQHFKKFEQGDMHYRFVTIPEGFNHYEMAQLLKENGWPYTQDFLRLYKDAEFIKKLLKRNIPSLEGYLLPDTYPINKYTTAPRLIERMVTKLLKIFDDMEKELGKLAELDQHQIFTLASIIEKETGVPQERPLIASVFYNRLKKNMKLQTDPTILYGLFLKRGFDIKKDIRKKDILSPTPYNTYVIKGLPPGPITNFGAQSLRAVFRPAKTDYLYFVSKNDGSHYFSKNYEVHKKAVYKYQIKAHQK